jgi:hypothetical protein
MKCVSMEEGKEILQEIAEGVCGNHAASRTLVGKAFRSGFYWLTALVDAKALARWCTNYSSLANSPMFRLITSLPYHPHGHFHAGAWT